MSEWKDIPLGELYEIRSGLSKPSSDFGTGYPFLSFKDVFYNVFVPEKLTQLVRSTPKERESCSIKRGDVFLTRTSETQDELGMSCVALKDYENATFNGFTKRLRPKQKIEILPEYAGYFFCSPKFRQGITAMSSLSTRASLNNEMLARLTVTLPPPPEQKAIASILSSLDDKIELNRRMNKTLEAMARVIFKDWFVDFGPTRAKQEGRAAYLPEQLWSLFPEVIDEETGLPQKWGMSKIEDFMELAYGKSLTAKNRLPGDVVVYGSGGETGFHNEAPISSPAVIVGRKGTVGSLYWEDRSIFPIDTVFYVVPKKASLFFCYQLLLAQPLANMNTDAAVPGLNRNNVYRLEFPYPGSDLLNAYESITSPIWAQRGINLKESRTLAEMRDRLLPKLMSGEIQVKDAEKMVEDAV
jgi:type I restriction enzyme S subunit